MLARSAPLQPCTPAALHPGSPALRQPCNPAALHSGNPARATHCVVEVAARARYPRGDHAVPYALQVRDALMEPVRMLQAATHFRQEADGAWAMCEPNERGAVQMRLMQVPPQQLRTPHVTLAHLERAMLATRPSVGPEDLHRFEEFTRLYGAGN